nr:MAG TPA: hypothetical protein [Caudoviricetes sp.]
MWWRSRPSGLTALLDCARIELSERREKGTPMTAKYPYSQALAKSLTEKLGGFAFVLPGGDVQADTPDGTLTVYADGAVRVRECGETEAWPTLRSAVADWGVEV